MASRPTSGLAAHVPPGSVVEDGLSPRAVTAAERLTARLDRLPMTRSLWIMAILLTFGGFFEGYAIGLIGALGPGLFKAKIFTATTVSFFGMTGFASFVAALFAGLFVASLFVSYIADHFGRRTVFTYSLIWFGVANLIMGMQTTADGVNLWRFISALGVGLELVTVDAYLSELVPKRVRGRAFAFLQAMSAIAFLVSYFLSWQLIPNNPFGYDGWRWVAWIGSIAAVVVWWIRLGLPESPRWLAQQGRMEEAEHVMSSIEARVIADYGRPLPEPEQPHYQDPRKGSLMEIFSPRYLRRTDHADAVQLLPDCRILRLRRMDAHPADRQGHPHHRKPKIQHDHQRRRGGLPTADHVVRRQAGTQMAFRGVVPGNRGVGHLVCERGEYISADNSRRLPRHVDPVALLRAA